MLVRGLLLGLLFFCLATRPAQAGVCADIKPWNTRINIDVILPEPHYDFTESKKSLTKKARKVTEEWVEKNKMRTLWKADDLTTAGLASGGQALSYDAKMMSHRVDRFGSYHCAFFQEINIAVFYRTLIFIPKDYPKGTCAHEDIHKHELRHHEANKSAIEKYIGKLKEDIHELVALMEEGYVNSAYTQVRFDEMKLGMQDAIQVYVYDYIRKEMETLNAQIDTPEEYARGGRVLEECRKKDGHRPPLRR